MSNHSQARCSQHHKYPSPVEKSSTKSGGNCDVIIGSVCSCGDYFDLILGYKLVSSKKLKNVTDYRPLHYGVKFDPTRPFTSQNRGGILRIKVWEPVPNFAVRKFMLNCAVSD